MLLGDNRGSWRECTSFITPSEQHPTKTTTSVTEKKPTVTEKKNEEKVEDQKKKDAPSKDDKFPSKEQFFDMEASDEGDWDDDIDQDILDLVSFSGSLVIKTSWTW
eukprot:sb/3477852/